MSDADAIRERIVEAQTILAALGLPTAQQNTLCSLVLLALPDLPPAASWNTATNPLRGIHGMRAFCISQYGYEWAVNTRESVRKTALHYFEAAQLIVKNPDDRNRKTNSAKTAYQITDAALAVIREFGTPAFSKSLPAYLGTFGALVDRYASHRTLEQVPLRLLTGHQVTLSPGTHSDLIEKIIREFGPRFTPDGVLIYAGDTGQKWAAYFDEGLLADLGVVIASTGAKMPDVVIYHEAKGWLVIVEAFDSVGPVDPLRRAQLEVLFADSTAPRVYVTAFHTLRAMAGRAGKIAWETEVWVAEAPDHLIHFNGERFLGPYE